MSYELLLKACHLYWLDVFYWLNFETFLYLVLDVLSFSSFPFACFLLHNSLGPSDDIHNSLFSWCCIPDRFLKLIWYRSILMMGEPGFIKGHASGHRKRLSLGSIWEIWSESENKETNGKILQVTLWKFKSPNLQK